MYPFLKDQVRREVGRVMRQSGTLPATLTLTLLKEQEARLGEQEGACVRGSDGGGYAGVGVSVGVIYYVLT